MQTNYVWKVCQTCGAPAVELDQRRGAFDVACSKCDVEPQVPSRWDAIQWRIRAEKNFELLVHGQESGILIALYGKLP